jgi:hypothetical protein
MHSFSPSTRKFEERRMIKISLATWKRFYEQLFLPSTRNWLFDGQTFSKTPYSSGIKEPKYKRKEQK